jgi:hypothetical protein
MNMDSGLADAAAALDDLAAGRLPDRARLLSGALTLDSLRLSGTADRDLLDAAAGLEIIKTGGTLDLDEKGRARAATLAAVVRASMRGLSAPTVG